MTPRQPSGDDHERKPPSAHTLWRHHAGAPLSLLIALVSAITIAGLWLVTLQRIAFEREQAVAAAMQSNANLAIAFEQQVFRTLKAAEQVAAFVREEYLRQGPNTPLPQWIERQVIREEMFTIISVVDAAGDIVASSRATGKVNYADREFFQAQRDLGMPSGLLVANPVPEAEQLDPTELDGVIEAAWAAAERDGISGQASTPYLLDYIRRATDGRSLDANVALYRNNVRLASEVAAALVARRA